MRFSCYIILVFILTFNIKSVFPQEVKTYNLDDVIVTSGRIPISYSEAIRNLLLIKMLAIKSIPSQSIHDILNNHSEIDLKSRGPVGVQSDIGIRGGTFEQTLILVDGIKLNDPQTAHHNLNLPFTFKDIEKIEILKGQGSSIFGPNAFSGIINFITKKNTPGEINFLISGGTNKFYNGELSAAIPIGFLSSRISFSKSKSEGYRYNTHFDNSTVSFSSSAKLTPGVINIIAGYNDNKFGANNFYSDIYPHQWERVKTLFTGLTTDLFAAGFNFSPKIFWKNKKDDYILDFKRPEFYHNIHKINSYGFELQVYKHTAIGSFAIGGEIGKDDIVSNSLGNHQRTNKGISAQYNSSPFEKLNIVIGTFAYKYGDFKWHIFPGFDVGYKLTNSLSIIGSVGKSFRVPSYTDLYYNSPAQKGNVLLQPEEAISYETGFNYRQEFSGISATFFWRDGKNIIDWVRVISPDPWVARNITEVNTKGIEFNFFLNTKSFTTMIPIESINLSYTYLDSDKKSENLQSRYVMDFLRHKITAIINNELPFGIKQGWTFKYCSRVNLQDYFIADTKISYNFSVFNIFVQAANLFNEAYSDFGSIPLPGRWLVAGIELNLFKGD